MGEQYKPGDVVNGHRLTPDNRWVPVTGDDPTVGGSFTPTTALPSTSSNVSPGAANAGAATRGSGSKRRWLLPLVVGIVAFLLGLAAGSAGKGSAPTAAAGSTPASTVTVTAPASGGNSTATVTAPPATVTITATAAAPAAPVPNADPAGPKENNEYLVNKEITPGQWRCTNAGNLTNWQTMKQGGQIIDIGVANSGSLIANVPGSAYSVKFDNCTVAWVKIG